MGTDSTLIMFFFFLGHSGRPYACSVWTTLVRNLPSYSQKLVQWCTLFIVHCTVYSRVHTYLVILPYFPTLVIYIFSFLNTYSSTKFPINIKYTFYSFYVLTKVLSWNILLYIPDRNHIIYRI